MKKIEKEFHTETQRHRTKGSRGHKGRIKINSNILRAFVPLRLCVRKFGIIFFLLSINWLFAEHNFSFQLAPVLVSPIGAHQLNPGMGALVSLDTTEIKKGVKVLQKYVQVPDIGETIKKIINNRLIGEYEAAVCLIDKLLAKL